MIVVTGAAGFIGSRIIHGLNALGRQDILAVDDLTDGTKFRNLAAVKFDDYIDYEDFLQDVQADNIEVELIFHQGACSDTTEWDGHYMLRNNYEYSKILLDYCIRTQTHLIYASSAAVYGKSKDFHERIDDLMPLNVYGYSKLLFDRYVQKKIQQEKITSQVVGLRYFNVYGPHEQHKGSMASVAFHLMNQLRDEGEARLFQGSHGYADGEQLRDFVYVDDVVKVNLWFMQNNKHQGIFNVGSGQARPFNTIANQLIECHGSGQLRYIPFPEKLYSSYQAYTQADLTQLRSIGYNAEFTSLEQGVASYYDWYRRYCTPVGYKYSEKSTISTK